MRRAHTTLLLTAAALTGCASSPAAQDRGTPAVHELALLQSMGRLDPARLTCVVAAVPPVARAVQARLGEKRAERAAVVAEATGDHARSVQEAMRASDESNAARQLAMEARRTAQLLNSRGDRTEAAVQQSYAMDLEAYAESQAAISVFEARDGDLWTEVEAAMLVEYATLRVRRARPSRTTPEVLGRIAGIEADHPEIMDAYAAIMLELYDDPELRCSPRS